MTIRNKYVIIVTDGIKKKEVELKDDKALIEVLIILFSLIVLVFSFSALESARDEAFKRNDNSVVQSPVTEYQRVFPENPCVGNLVFDN